MTDKLGMCLIPDYRQAILDMANISFCLRVIKPPVSETDIKVHNIYKGLCAEAHNNMNLSIQALQQTYGIPYAVISRDIKECIAHLPHDDIKASLDAAKDNRLH